MAETKATSTETSGLTPWHIDLLPTFPNSKVGTYAWTTEGTNVQLFRSYKYNSSDAVNDELAWLVPLEAGTYTISLLTVTQINGGQVRWYIDNSAVGSTIDLYSNPQVVNVENSQTGIVVSRGGVKTITLRVTGKNASSSNRYMLISHATINRTA